MLANGKKRFNSDSKNGIGYLIENKLIDNTPQSVAQFLYDENKDLSLFEMGKYLGASSGFNIQVLHFFLKLHQFQNEPLDKTIRNFFSKFHLPTEFLSCNFIIETFAYRYNECNPGLFINSESCYHATYAYLMLKNIDLKRLTSNELTDLVSNDKQNRIMGKNECNKYVVNQSDNDLVKMTMSDSVKEGWLWKRGNKTIPFNAWKLRWFILKKGSLYYFKLKTDKTPKGCIQLKNVNVRQIVNEDKIDQYHFEIYSTNDKKIKAFHYNNSKEKLDETVNREVYQLWAATQKEKLEWIAEIKKCIQI
jgi:cytohesin